MLLSVSTTPLKKGMTDDEIGVRVHDQLCSRTTSSSNSTVRCTFFGDKYCHKGSPQAYLASLQTIEAAANLSYTTVMIYINMNIPRLLYFYGAVHLNTTNFVQTVFHLQI